ncbi:MAG TPA: pyridoxamine 5'-phosphate oxidase family protein [Selenomonadales bacterium]|nr:pyridoxamine 5'-phosphate oxidase family protein [Selenomonadales bacterium]
MFKTVRRQDRVADQAEAEEILRGGDYGVLSMNSGDYAYGVPLSYVYTGGCIYFHCAPEGKKLDLIRDDGKVSFCVVGEATTLAEQFSVRYKSAVVFGRAVVVTADDEKLKALVALIEKYTPTNLENGKKYVHNAHAKTAVIRLDIDHLTAKARR